MFGKVPEKIKNIRFLAEILLAAVIALQIINVIFIFVNDKKQCHCDEVYSYGLSNSFYQPFVGSQEFHMKDLKGVNEWISGDASHDYITVQEGEQFRYDSVWYNQGQDRHPPLFYVVIHTVCSFFPDTFSFWFGFIPNLVYFAVTQFFLYKLGKNILKSRYLALLFCTFYGFTPAAISNTLFIRMYCMLTMWTVIFMYLHSRLSITENNVKIKQFIPFTVITALGVLTQYLFLFVAFVTAVCYCLWYIINKKYKTFLIYGFSMLTGALLLFAIFPKGIDHLFYEGGNASGYLIAQFPITVRYMLSDVFAVSQSIFVWLAVFLPPFIGILIILSLPVLFLFRDKLDLKQLPKKFTGKLKGIFKLKLSERIKGLKSKQPVIFVLFISTAVIMVLVSDTVPYLMGYANRYLYIIYPFVVLIVFILISKIFRIIHFEKTGAAILTVIMVYNVIANGSIVMYWTYNNNTDPHTLFDNSNVITVVENPGRLGLISVLSYELCNTDNIFMTDYEDIDKYVDDIGNVPTDSPLYIMICKKGIGLEYNSESSERERFDDYVNDICDKISVESSTYVGEYSTIQGEYYIYRLSKI